MPTPRRSLVLSWLKPSVAPRPVAGCTEQSPVGSPRLRSRRCWSPRTPWRPRAERAQGKGKWHRCKVHRKHTCWKAKTCRHRRHKPQARPTTTSPWATRSPAPRTELPDAAALHLASRFSYGMTPALHAEMQAVGGPAAWFAAQLQPSSVADPVGDGLQSWWASVDLDSADDHATRQERGRGRLGGDGELPALVPAAAHLLQAPGARGRHGVLREPPARARSRTTASLASGRPTAS